MDLARKKSEQLKNNLDGYLKRLLELKKLHPEVAQKIIQADSENKLFELDLFYLSLIQRSLSLINGFCTLIKENNFLCAAPIVRMHLDNLLQTYAAFIVKKPHDFAREKIEGKQSGNLKDKNGEKMTDSYLARSLSRFTQLDANFAVNVYKESSKFVHASNKHCFSIVQKLEKNGLILSISDNVQVPEKFKIEATLAMIKITECLMKLWCSWVTTKNQKK